MVGPNGLEPSTSSVSRKRSNQTELRAYMRMAALPILMGAGRLRQCFAFRPSPRIHELENSAPVCPAARRLVKNLRIWHHQGSRTFLSGEHGERVVGEEAP